MDSSLNFTVLQKLSIRLLFDFYLEGISEDPYDYEPMMMFDKVPLLHEVLMYDAPPFFAPLPWQQLTKFTGERYTLAACLEALHLMPNLAECAFAVFRQPDGDHDSDGLLHPNIHHFSLFASSMMTELGNLSRAPELSRNASSSHILAFLTLPALQTLEIQGVNDFDEMTFNSFLSRSSPPLRKLSVCPYDGKERQDASIQLQLSPAFISLGLTDLQIWYPKFEFLPLFLEPFSQDTDFLSQLQHLSFLGHLTTECKGTASYIVKMAGAPVTARRNLEGCAPLQSFRVISATRNSYPTSRYPEAIFTAEDLLPFKNLKASGMDIHIGSELESVI
jgi:hypothetical protein